MTDLEMLIARLATMPLRQAAEFLCYQHGTTLEELAMRSRHLLRRRDDCRRRQAIWWTLRQIRTGNEPRWSYPDIAGVWGTAHSTVITAVQREDQRQTQSEATR